MKVTKTVVVKFESVYCGYREIEFTDVDGSEVKVRLTDEQWKDLGLSVSRKVAEIDRKEKEAFECAVERAVEDAAKFEAEQS